MSQLDMMYRNDNESGGTLTTKVYTDGGGVTGEGPKKFGQWVQSPKVFPGL